MATPVDGRAGIPRAFCEAPLEPVRAVAGRGQHEWAGARTGTGTGGDDGEDDEAEREKVRAHGCCCHRELFFLDVVACLVG